MSLATAAAYLDLTPGGLQKRMERGAIPNWTWKRVGRTYKFDRQALDEWMTEEQEARRGRRKPKAVAA